MSLVGVALVLAFVAGLVAALVAIAAYNMYADWRSQRIWDKVVDDWTDRHDIVDGECVTCGWLNNAPARAAAFAAGARTLVETVGGNDPDEWLDYPPHAVGLTDDEEAVLQECGY